MGYIYKITNLINKKSYIGETMQNDVFKRWSTHKNLSKLNKGCPALKEAFKKYGIYNFKFEVLIICFDEDMLIYEKEYIKKYNTVAPNGYNISEGGCERGFTGLHHTEDTRKKISEAVKKRYANPEERQKASEKIKKIYKDNNVIEKRAQGEKWKKALAEGRLGRKRTGEKTSDETKKKISESVKKALQTSNKDQIYNEAFMTKVCRKINQLSLTGEYIKSFNSIADAAREVNKSSNTIKAVLSKRTKTAGGFKWEYTPSDSA